MLWSKQEIHSMYLQIEKRLRSCNPNRTVCLASKSKITLSTHPPDEQIPVISAPGRCRLSAGKSDHQPDGSSTACAALLHIVRGIDRSAEPGTRAFPKFRVTGWRHAPLLEEKSGGGN